MDIQELRKKGVESLSMYIKNKKNVGIIEKNILESCLRHQFEMLEETYKQSIIDTIIKINNGMKLRDILSLIKNGRLSWDSPEFDDCKFTLDEYDEFLENPFEIEDGVLECNKCGSKRTFSYTKQTRAGDEATSVFSQCAKCGAKWKT